MATVNLIQIKRSSGNATPSSLNSGELAYSFASSKLFIGNSTLGVTAIGGGYYTGLLSQSLGTLTASAALLVDSNSFINNIIVGNLTFATVSGGSIVSVNTIITDTGLAGASNASLATSGAIKTYIDSLGSATALAGLNDVTLSAPANGQVLFYDGTTSKWENLSLTSGINAITIKPAANLTVGNSTVNTSVTSTAFLVNGSAFYAPLASPALTGTPTAPTPTSSDNTTKIATTAFVVTALLPYAPLASPTFTGTLTTPGANLTSVTTSSNTTTGTLVVAGGVGIGGNVAIGGTIIGGVWQGGTVGVPYGGTGNASSPANGQVLVGNSTGGYTIAGLTSGNNIVITNSSGGIAIGLTNNVTIQGNLTVLGVTTTVDSTTLVANSNFLELNDTNLTSDSVDFGFYGPYGNSTVTSYTGLSRKAADGKYYLWNTTTQAPGGTANTSAGTATLVAHLQDSNVTITGGSIAGISLSGLTAPLAVADGGTGLSAYTNTGIFYASATNTIGFLTGTFGQVLQINSSGSPVFTTLDGGSF